MSTDEFKPVSAFDVSDENPAAVSGQLRALQREVRDGFDGIGRALQALVRIEQRIDVVIDRQNHLDRRYDELERRVAKLEAPVVFEGELQAPPVRVPVAVARKRRKPARKK